MYPILNVLHLLDKIRVFHDDLSIKYDSLLKEVNDRVHTMLQFTECALAQIRSMGRSDLLSDAEFLELAKDVLKDLPQFSDPEREARDSVQIQQFIIDRTTEREEIVHLLLKVNTNDDPATASVVPILGNPGSGKTSLALLAYHDIRTTSCFDYQLWVDVSRIHDSYDHKFNIREWHLLHDLNDEVELLWEAQKQFSSGNFAMYFHTLLKGGNFNEDISRSSKTSVPVYYKAWVLMHEVMKYQLVRDDNRLLYIPTEEVDHNLIRHVSFIVDPSWKVPSWLLKAKQLESLHFIPSKSCSLIMIPEINEILENNMELRALDLAIVNCRSCLNSIGKLTNLRYLRLGACSELLSECITHINYLYTLDLRHSGVQQLPDCFHENLKFSLRQLHVGNRLIDLPPRFKEFSKLQTLDVFIVGKNNKLSTLVPFTQLSGKLKIQYQIDRKKAVPEKELFLADLRLKSLSLVWSSSTSKPFGKIDQMNEALEYEFMRPHPTLKNLVVQGYNRVSFPGWAMNHFSLFLRNLVSLRIKDCNYCQYLPSFNTIPNLEYLQLCGLDALEWIENCDDNTYDASSASSVKAFFPSLKFLKLVNLLQLKGWEKFNKQDVSQKVFKSLSELRIAGCPHLMSLPLVPKVETLRASNIHAKLLEKILNGQESEVPSTLKELHINSVHELESLSVTVPSLQVLTIRKCKELINVGSESKTLLRCIEIQDCSRLKDILPVLHNLSILEELKIENCQELNCKALTDDVEEIRGNSGAVWKGLESLCWLKLTNIIKWEFLLCGLNCFETLQRLSLNWDYKLRALPDSIGQPTQLQCLDIRYFPNLVNLPESLGQLSPLQNMVIQYCPKLKQLPQSFHYLKTLRRLEIRECIVLKRRCLKPDGEDGPVVEHIPKFLLM